MASLVVAQDYRGKVQGSVTDDNGGVVPGAHVVLRNVKTGVENQPRVGTAMGTTSSTSSSPAITHVTIEQAGFKKAVQENIQRSRKERPHGGP